MVKGQVTGVNENVKIVFRTYLNSSNVDRFTSKKAKLVISYRHIVANISSAEMLCFFVIVCKLN